MEVSGADERTTQAVLDENAQARSTLRAALALLAIVAVVAPFFTSDLARPPGAAGSS